MMPAFADLLLVNGRFLTLHREPEDVRALAAKDGRVVALDSSEERLGAYRGPDTRVVDLRGRVAVPGLSDAHFHLAYFGMTSQWLNLSDAETVDGIVGAVRKAVDERPTGSWVYGRGWDAARLAGGRIPSLADLDGAAPGNAVLLARADGHLCLANSESLRRAGVTATTLDPPGGRIERAGDGTPTGALSERALYLAWDAMMAELTPADFREPILRGCDAAVRAGITTAHAVLLENVPAELDMLWQLDAAGELPLNVYAMVPVEALDTLPRELLMRRGQRFRVGAAKIFADGTLFAGTAALRAPYADSPTSAGQAAYSQPELTALIAATRDAGLQPAVHAVGDRTVSMVLDAVEDVYGAAASRAARPRIEHAAVLAPDLIRRAHDLGVVLSLQARRWRQLAPRLGAARAAWVNPWPALASAGVSVAGGSDAPFIARTPGLWEVVTEAVARGIAFEDALRILAEGAARATQTEGPVGLSVGGVADVTVLSDDPRDAPPDELRGITPIATIVGGVVAFDETGR